MTGLRTPATATLDAAGVPYHLHSYSASAKGRPGRDAYGAEAAEALGVDPARVFKTLVVEVDPGGPALALVPVDGSLDLKALAAACGAKRAVMAEPTTAQRITGYVVGGIAPLGSRRALPVLVDRSALAVDTLFCSAGRRGLQLELTPPDLVAVSGATVADLAG